MSNTDLLQLTVNSFITQIEHLDKEIQNTALQLESYKTARSSMLASVSVLETRIAEMRLEEPEQFELNLDDDLDESLGRTCFVGGEECESCQ